MPIDPSLANYIKTARDRGMSDESIRILLLNAGWKAPDIDEAFKGNSAPLMPPMPSSAVSSAARVNPLQNQPQVQQQNQPQSHPNVKPQTINFSSPVSVKLQPAHSNKKVITTAAAILLVLGLGAGSAFGYFYYFRQQLTPEQVLNKMYGNLSTIKTVTFSVDMNSTIYPLASSSPAFNSVVGGSATSSQPLSMNLKGSLNLSDPAGVKESFNMNLSVGVAPTLAFSTDIVLLKNIFYVKLKKFELGSDTQKPNPISSILAIFTNQWFKVDPTAITQTFLKDKADQFSKIQSSTQLTPDKIQKVIEMTQQYQVVTVEKVLPNETIDNQNNYHYALALNKEAYRNYMLAVYPLLYDENNQVISYEQFKSAINTYIDNLFNDVRFNNLEIWIGAKDFYPHKFYANFVVYTPNGEKTDEVEWHQQADFNQQVNVVAPEGAKDVNEILGGIFGSFAQQPTSTKPAKIPPKKINLQ